SNWSSTPGDRAARGVGQAQPLRSAHGDGSGPAPGRRGGACSRPCAGLMSDPLPGEFRDALRASARRRRRFGEPVYYFVAPGSTNDVAAALAEAGAAEGTMVVASAQTRGRGRFGRDWFSPPGAGLYVSLVCRNPAAAPMLTLAGGVAVADGVRAATGLPVQ